jgi:hypothetical protein
MDILAIVFGKLKIIHPSIEPQVIGRWALYILRGKFVHKDIYKTPTLKNEKSAALISHYLIGIILAGVYLFMELKEPVTRDQPWIALVFGLLTILLPWLWLFPSIGIGFLASKKSKKSPYIITSLINHTDFGLGLAVWILVFRPLFI